MELGQRLLTRSRLNDKSQKDSLSAPKDERFAKREGFGEDCFATKGHHNSLLLALQPCWMMSSNARQLLVAKRVKCGRRC